MRSEARRRRRICGKSFHGSLKKFTFRRTIVQGERLPLATILEEDRFLPFPQALTEGDVRNVNEDESDQGSESGGSDLTSLPPDDEA